MCRGRSRLVSGIDSTWPARPGVWSSSARPASRDAEKLVCGQVQLALSPVPVQAMSTLAPKWGPLTFTGGVDAHLDRLPGLRIGRAHSGGWSSMNAIPSAHIAHIANTSIPDASRTRCPVGTPENGYATTIAPVRGSR